MKITVEGHGVFDINEQSLPALLSFLASAKSVRIAEDTTIRERNDGGYTGRELLQG